MLLDQLDTIVLKEQLLQQLALGLVLLFVLQDPNLKEDNLFHVAMDIISRELFANIVIEVMFDLQVQQ